MARPVLYVLTPAYAEFLATLEAQTSTPTTTGRK